MKKQRNPTKANRNIPPDSFSQKSPHLTSSSGSILGICIGLIAVNLFIYAGVWSFDFVNYDDPGYLQNANVAAGLTWAGLSWALRSGSMSN